MEKAQSNVYSNINYYCQAARQLPTNASNYLNRKVEVLRSYGNAISDFATQTMQQIRQFTTRTIAVINIGDQAGHFAFRGLVLGSIAGAFGAPIGFTSGLFLGAMVGLFTGINELANELAREAAAA